ncbi:MAG: DUF7488 domain-containing protein [Campylobacterota bacterium]
MRKFVVALLFGLNLFATDCDHCAQKFKDATLLHEGVKQLHVGSEMAIAAAPTQGAIYNKFFHIYLVSGVKGSEKITLKYPYIEQEGGLYTHTQHLNTVKIERGCALRYFGQVDKPLKPLSIVTGICCDVMGVANSKLAVIDAKYLKDFIQRKSDLYGDLGLRFNKKMEVTYINPYYTSQLKVGDRVLGYADICALEDAILLATPKERMQLRVLRQGDTKEFALRVHKRYGGGFVSDSFLEQFGIRFDEQLQIIEIANDSLAYQKGLRRGDRLLEIDTYAVQDTQEVKEFFTKNQKKSYSFLFDRDSFEFFVRI